MSHALSTDTSEWEADEAVAALSWRDDAFLAQHGLDGHSFLPYLANSPFYVRPCTNDSTKHLNSAILALVMQNIPWHAHGAHLAQHRGLEHRLLSADPPLFVAARHLRSSPSEAALRSIVYAVEGVVYRAPSVQALVRLRLGNAFRHLSEALALLNDFAVFDPLHGYTWNSELSTEPERPPEVPQDAAIAGPLLADLHKERERKENERNSRKRSREPEPETSMKKARTE